MKYKYLVLIILSLVFSLSFAQNAEMKENNKYLKTYGKIDLSFSGLGISIETPISNKVLLDIAVGMGAEYRIDENFKYRLYFDDPAVFGSLYGKYYYNQQKRVDAGRPVTFNAGNFFGLKLKYASPTIRNKETWHTLLAGVHWGMQRKMGRHFMYQLNVGIGAAVDLENKSSTELSLFPDFNFRMSYVLPF